MNIGGFIKNSFVDYPGKISCVVFTNGCNMNCWYCHNKHLLQKEEQQITEQEIFDFLKTHKQFIDAITISGGEPTLQKDLIPFIKKVKDLGYLIKLDTNGTNYEILKTLIDNKLLDYVAMDIKAPLNKYNLVTATYNIEEIKKSISLLKQDKIQYEFRTTLIPALTVEDVREIAKELQGAENYSLQKLKYYNEKDRLNPELETALFNAKDIAKQYIKNVIIKGI